MKPPGPIHCSHASFPEVQLEKFEQGIVNGDEVNNAIVAGKLFKVKV